MGGRLIHSELSYAQRHPILLPGNSRLTRLLVLHYHQKYLHAGPSLTLSCLREKFWILKARQVVRQVINQCVPCFRAKPKVSSQLMGQLPSSRVCQPNRPFTYTGVDYAGPILVRATTGRGRIRTEKGYIAVFVGFSTKAVHLEAVTDLTASAFLAAFERFASRRGLPQEIYSDCGTNCERK